MKKLLVLIPLLITIHVHSMLRTTMSMRYPVKSKILHRLCASNTQKLTSFQAQQLAHQKALVCVHILNGKNHEYFFDNYSVKNTMACQKYLDWWVDKFTDIDATEEDILTAIDPEYYKKDQFYHSTFLHPTNDPLD